MNLIFLPFVFVTEPMKSLAFGDTSAHTSGEDSFLFSMASIFLYFVDFAGWDEAWSYSKINSLSLKLSSMYEIKK